MITLVLLQKIKLFAANGNEEELEPEEAPEAPEEVCVDISFIKSLTFARVGFSLTGSASDSSCCA